MTERTLERFPVKGSDAVHYSHWYRPLVRAFHGRLIDANCAISFDGNEQLPYHQSQRRYVDRTHYQWVARAAGNRVCMDFDELLRSVQIYLEQPHLDAEGRARVAALGGPLDRAAGRRAAEVVIGHLERVGRFRATA